MSLHAEGGPIFLPCKRLGKLLGCSAIEISRILGLLKKNGLLRETDGKWSYKKGEAKSYTFHPPQDEIPF